MRAWWAAAVLLVGCGGHGGTELGSQQQEQGESAMERAAPQLPGAPPGDDEASPYPVDGPQMPGNWQCVTCLAEGRKTYVCGSEPEPMTATCGGEWGPALSTDLSACVGVWLDEDDACLLPGVAGVRGLLAMCGPDSDDVGMMCGTGH